ncbi:MAG: TM2 domain-containing protein [Thiothrix sp.]|uniref:TM2 domain-containing protein n=1 Tax=Thiothrix sp. TaxID=1032 RepID=UPI00260B2F69|nr:TM2 domain-containing protein [Thiothrix sp.]MDD5392423.1 TM2 domain-containing protein [Thiothrix sp.]
MAVEDDLGRLIPGYSLMARKMDDDARMFIVTQFKKKRKSVWPALLLWLISLHYAYFGRWGLQVVFWVTLGGFGIWWLIDIFRLDGLTARFNEDIALSIAQTAKIMHS